MTSRGLTLSLITTMAIAVATAGCSYTSEYVAPRDGRARVIWDDDTAVIAAPEELPQCALYDEQEGGEPGSFRVPVDSGGYYVPSRGSTNVSVGVIIIGRPPIFLTPVPVGFGSSSSGGGSGANVSNAEYLVVALAVGAIIAFPFVATGLALGHPEPEQEVADAIDEVNQYNDESREIMARCAAYHQRGGR